MGLWAQYKNRWFKRLDAAEKRREQTPLRLLWDIEIARLSVVNLQSDERPIANISGYVACDWPTTAPTPDSAGLYPDEVYLSPGELDKLIKSGESPPHGTVSRTQSAILVLTDKRIHVRMLHSWARSTASHRYRTYPNTSMVSRVADVDQVIGASLLDVSETPLIHPEHQIRSDAEYLASTGAALLALDLRPSREGSAAGIRVPRWPDLDYGRTGYNPAWSTDSGLMFTTTMMTVPPYSEATSVMARALNSLGIAVEGNWWDMTLELGLGEDWRPTHELLTALKDELLQP